MQVEPLASAEPSRHKDSPKDMEGEASGAAKNNESTTDMKKCATNGESIDSVPDDAIDAMEVDEQGSDVNAMNGNAMNDSLASPDFAELRLDRFGSIGRSVPFDPFLRTRSVPFRVAGRRNSISVFNTIDEADNADNGGNADNVF